MKELMNFWFESLNINFKKRNGYYYWSGDDFIKLSIAYSNYLNKIRDNLWDYEKLEDDYFIEKGMKIEKDYWKALLFFYKLFFQWWSLKCRIEENWVWKMFIFYDENFNIWKKEDLGACEILRFIFRKFETHVFWILKIETTWRFEQVYKMWGSFYKKNFYYEFIDFIDSINEKYLSRVDFFHDYKGKIEEDFYKLNFHKKKANFYGWIVEVENKKIKIKEECTIYWWSKWKTDILVRSYNKYIDSVRKKKLFLYDYLTRDTRRLEFEVKSKYLGKIRTRKKQDFKNMSVLDMVGFVYNNIINEKVGKKTFSFNLHFEKKDMFERIDQIRKEIFILKKSNLELESYKDFMIYWIPWEPEFWKYAWKNKKEITKEEIYDEFKKSYEFDYEKINKEEEKKKKEEKKKAKKRFLSNGEFILKNWNRRKKIDYNLEYRDLSYVEKVLVNLLTNMTKEQGDELIKDIKILTKKRKEKNKTRKNRKGNVRSYHYQKINKEDFILKMDNISF